MLRIDKDFIYKFVPVYRTNATRHAAQASIIDGMSHELASTLDRYEINTIDRLAHFLAQVCVESAGFSVLSEEGDEAYFDKYDGRNGNKLPGDGAKYKGRGLIQLTFRSNYERIGCSLGLDLANDPDLVLQPYTYLLVACEYWKENNINSACDAPGSDEARVAHVTKIVNGPGLNGLRDRQSYLDKIKPLLVELAKGESPPATPLVPAGPEAPPQKQPPQSPATLLPTIPLPMLPLLDYGSSGYAVRALEALLVSRGYLMTGTVTDVIQKAVREFQKASGLEADGVVGPATWAKLLQNE